MGGCDDLPEAPGRRAILIEPLMVFGAMLLLGLASLGYAYWPDAPAKPLAALLIVVAQASLVGGLFMRLGKASGLVRMAAVIGVVWLGFLFLMSFADLLTRP